MTRTRLTGFKAGQRPAEPRYERIGQGYADQENRNRCRSVRQLVPTSGMISEAEFYPLDFPTGSDSMAVA